MTELRWMRPQLDAATRATALALLSPVELERYLGTPTARQDTFLTGRFLVRTLAAELLRLDPAAIVVRAQCPDCGGPHGRPVIANSRLQVSLAHSPAAVVVAMEWDAAVGVDIEPVAQSAQALDAIQALAGEGSIRRWTQVEAILKADGRGLRVDPSLVSIDEIDEHGDTVHGRVQGSPTTYRLSEITLDPAVQVSVAVALEDLPRDI